MEEESNEETVSVSDFLFATFYEIFIESESMQGYKKFYGLNKT